MFDRFRRDETAVSPVISVILMVAIAVILAAVISTVVLGIGEDLGNPAPSATFDVDTETVTFEDGGGRTHSAAVVTITQTNGETISTDNLRVTINGKQAWDVEGLHGSDGETVRPLDGIDSTSAGTQFRVVLWENEYGGYPVGSGNLEFINSGGCNVVFSDSTASDDCALANDEIEGGETVRVVWSNPDGTSSSILEEATVTIG